MPLGNTQVKAVRLPWRVATASAMAARLAATGAGNVVGTALPYCASQGFR